MYVYIYGYPSARSALLHAVHKLSQRAHPLCKLYCKIEILFHSQKVILIISFYKDQNLQHIKPVHGNHKKFLYPEIH